MCNLYNVTTTQQAVIEWTRAMRDLSGNWAPSMTVGPDRHGPIVRNAIDGQRDLARVRWGLPSSQYALMEATKKRVAKLKAKGQTPDFTEMLKMEPDAGTTNVRKVESKHWTRWLGVENRCVVPITSFAEWDKVNRRNQWFAVAPDCPLAFFAGIWIPQWTSVRKIKEGPVTIDLYAFLTTDANDVVRPIHDKAMPAILTTQEETETWLNAPWEEARHLQRPLPNNMTALVDAPKEAITIQ